MMRFAAAALLTAVLLAPGDARSNAYWDDAAFSRFWESFSKAACARDVKTVSSMTLFPFRYSLSYFGARKEEYFDLAVFQSRFREIFSNDAIERIFREARLNGTVNLKTDRGGSCTVTLSYQPATGTYAAWMWKTGNVASSMLFHFIRSGDSFVLFACEAHSD